MQVGVDKAVREGLIRELNYVREEDLGEEGRRGVCNIPQAKEQSVSRRRKSYAVE